MLDVYRCGNNITYKYSYSFFELKKMFLVFFAQKANISLNVNSNKSNSVCGRRAAVIRRNFTIKSRPTDRVIAPAEPAGGKKIVCGPVVVPPSIVEEVTGLRTSKIIRKNKIFTNQLKKYEY